MNRRNLLVIVLVATLLVPLAPGATADHSEAVADGRRIEGYIPVAVGTDEETTLHYQVLLPDPDRFGAGPYPAVVDYSGYMPAITIYDGLHHRFLAAGYAVAGVNIRGTGCSGGKFDYFEPRQSVDGAEAIDFLGSQDWSNGRVAMVGKSYPGITQLFVAAQQPEHLTAIVPGHVFGDLYRDVPFPGGILNATFAGGWSAGRLVETYVGPQHGLENGDQECLANQPEHAVNPVFNPFTQAVQPQNMWDGALFHERSPFWWADRIQVPTFLIQSWQDEQVGSRATNLLERLDPAVPRRFLGTNGDHGEYYGDEVFPYILEFLEVYMDPATTDERRAAYEAEDPVIINWENGALGDRRSAWTERYADWPVPGTEAWRLWLHEDGSLQDGPAAVAGNLPTRLDPANARLAAGPVDWVYAPEVGSQQRGGFSAAGEPEASWDDRPPEGTHATFTSGPLDGDKVLLGTASLDLWISSTAPDTDMEVTLSEVRPDGQEIFVQQGWLRASHRREDPSLSTPLRPFQTHLLTDSAALLPGHPTTARVEIFPFGHVLREGSRVRVTVAAPHIHPDLWGFAALPTPAVNTLYTKGSMASSLALPLVPGEAQAPLPPCTLRNQPCRAED